MPVFFHVDLFEVRVVFATGELVVWREGTTWRKFDNDLSKAELVRILRESDDWQEIT